LNVLPAQLPVLWVGGGQPTPPSFSAERLAKFQKMEPGVHEIPAEHMSVVNDSQTIVIIDRRSTGITALDQTTQLYNELTEGKAFNNFDSKQNALRIDLEASPIISSSVGVLAYSGITGISDLYLEPLVQIVVADSEGNKATYEANSTLDLGGARISPLTKSQKEALSQEFLNTIPLRLEISHLSRPANTESLQKNQRIASETFWKLYEGYRVRQNEAYKSFSKRLLESGSRKITIDESMVGKTLEHEAMRAGNDLGLRHFSFKDGTKELKGEVRLAILRKRIVLAATVQLKDGSITQKGIELPGYIP